MTEIPGINSSGRGGKNMNFEMPKGKENDV